MSNMPFDSLEIDQQDSEQPPPHYEDARVNRPETYHPTLVTSSLCHVPKLSAGDVQLQLSTSLWPIMVFCHLCNTFHECPAQGYDIGGAKCAANGQYVGLSSNHLISWWYVYLQMRVVRLRSEYDNLQPFIDKGAEYISDVWRNASRLTVVDNRLLTRLKACKKLELDNIHEGMRTAPFCQHLLWSPRLKAHLTQVVMQAIDTGRAQYHSPLFRCIWCPTESKLLVERFRVTIAEEIARPMEPLKHEYRLTVIVYKDFGTCETPRSSEWYDTNFWYFIQ